MKLQINKAPGFKEVDEGFVEILACSLGWLLVKIGVRCAWVRSWSVALVMMSKSAGSDLKSYHWKRTPGLGSPSFDS